MPLPDIGHSFWRVLAMRLTLLRSTMDRRLTAGRWLGQLVCAPERQGCRREIARAIEDTALDLLSAAESKGHSGLEQQAMLSGLAVALLEPPLGEVVDETLCRLLPFLLGLQNERGTLVVRNQDGEELPILQISEVQKEQEALEFVRDAQSERRFEDVCNSLDAIRFDLRVPLPRTTSFADVHIDIPLVRLLLHDDRRIQDFLISQLFVVLQHVDPALAVELEPLRVPRLRTTVWQRREAIRRFCHAYLASVYFDLRRDLRHGLTRLRSRPLEDLDAICGIDMDLVKDADSFFEAALCHTGGELPHTTTVTMVLFLAMSHTDLGPIIQLIRNLDAERTAGRGGEPGELSHLAERVLSARNVFQSLYDLLFLLAIGSEPGSETRTITAASATLPAPKWVSECILFLLTTNSSSAGVQSSPLDASAEAERHRRNVHAMSLRITTWISASPIHIRELAERAEPGDRVIYGWLLRGLILSDRLMPILCGVGERNLEETEHYLHGLLAELQIESCAATYPDVLDPFLYGPDRYDHAVAILLTLLLASWKALTTSAKRINYPFWWSSRVKVALREIASRPQNEAETTLRARREQPNSNRLGEILTRTPQELSREILALAACDRHRALCWRRRRARYRLAAALDRCVRKRRGSNRRK